MESDNVMLIETIRHGLTAQNASKVVDCIAKGDGGIIEQLVILEDPPHYVRCWLEEDIRQSLVTDDNFI
ncbi:hypothetical protein Goari_022286 [Gossypium aridum]|uniref:RNase H type-1 domain-containing protein n=1 Tax=Gossypium aridum TaxID=34290 RepID=A0A7J8YLC9_GOSAI|nr:hypothetical protein [Gossypium aridum]